MGFQTSGNTKHIRHIMAVDRDIFVDVFGEIVDEIRATGTITNSSEISGVYTITSTNTLSEDEYITILSVDYKVTNVSTSGFTITATTGIDFIGETWQALAPYYMYGHPLEIANRLNLKDRLAVEKFKKWPLIYLRTDVNQKHGEYKNILYEIDAFTIYIISPTISTYTTPERIENIFIPILYPLYNTLLDKIELSRVIARNNIGISHNHYDRYGWGNETVYGNEGLIFNQYLDAMEIIFNNTQVYKNNDTCQ